jgi:hypothetical protein
MSGTTISDESTLDISTATIRITTTRVRDSTSTNFYPNPPEVRRHLVSTYNMSGQRQNLVTMSDDGLTLTTVTYWVNRQSWLYANFNDPIPIKNGVDHEAYCQANNIVLTRIKEKKINDEWSIIDPVRPVDSEWREKRFEELTSSTTATIWTDIELLRWGGIQ